jgi:zinc protease
MDCMSRCWGHLLPLVASFLLTPAARADEPRRSDTADAALMKTAARLYEGIRAETFDNGLRVFLKPIPGAPTVTTMVAYKVGSADEDLTSTGLSHYLEHLMFKGTDKLMPGDIDRVTQRNGGRNNAYTTEDMTVFHFDFAAERWQAALEIEADRMRNLRIDEKHEFEQEKGAVIAELEGGEDHPWELENKIILPLLFGEKTPYGHPVIGQREHVRAATANIIKRHYDAWYHPNNATLVIVGGFDEKEALGLVKKLFGDIPRVELPGRNPAQDPPPRKQTVRHKMASKFESPRILLGFNTVRSGDSDSYALDFLQNVLASGKTSRLYRRLVEGDRLATSVSASHSCGRYPGWFAIQSELLKDELPKVEGIILEEIRKVAEKGISREEWARTRRGMMAGFIFGHEDIHDMADTIAQGIVTNDLDYVKNYLPRVAAVTPEEVQRVAKKYFVDAKGVVIWSQPSDDGDKGGNSPLPTSNVQRPTSNIQRQTLHGRRLPRDPNQGAGPAAFSLKDARTVTLPNGLTLLLLENHRLPIVVAEAFVRNVQMREPADKAGVAALVGEMLAEGTAARTGKEIAREIEDVGGVLSMDSDGGTVKVLTPDTDLGLDLMFDCLTGPTFPAEELENRRELLISSIEDAEGAPQSSSELTFNRLVYDKHPLGRSHLGNKDVVEKLTAGDCRTFHQSVFRPNNTLVAIVGDFDAKKVIDGITQRTGAWKRADMPALPAFVLKKPQKFVQQIETDAEASQVHVYLGHLGIRRDNPDFHTLLVMEHVLGTGPGFTDRLSANLRDRQGLAYTVHATITPSASEEVGTFLGYIGTYPDKFGVVKEGFMKEIRRIRDEPPSAEEVEDAKKYLLGSVAFRFNTNEAVAGQLLQIERFHLGFNYLEKYRAAVEAVTPEAVQAAAKKYLDPDRITLVAVGPIDQDGKPVKKDKEP